MGRLFWKFLFAFWTTLLVTALGAGAAVWLHEREVREMREARAEHAVLAAGPRAEFVVRHAAATLRHGGPEALRALLADPGLRAAESLFVVDADGRDLLGRPVPAEALTRARERDDPDGMSWAARTVTAADGRTQWLLFMAAGAERGPDARPGAHPERRMGRPPGLRPPDMRRAPPLPPGLLLAIGLTAGLAFSVLLAWYVSRPIGHLRWAFDAAAQGRLDIRVQPRMGARRDEIADLGRDFDRMVRQLQNLVASQRRLLHDVSHELRSPLARLQAAAGLARRDPAKVDDLLDRVERESVRLDGLIEQMLTLSRLEADTDPEQSETIDLSELVAAVVDDARLEAQAAGRSVHFEGEARALVAARVEALHRACENVIRNAVKFTAQGTCVEVRVTAPPADGQVLLIVSDRGPGVAPAELEAIFTPFRRGSNSRDTSGFGLGLAIARQAVVLHGGTIRATNREGGGLEIVMALPRAPSLSDRDGELSNPHA